MTNFDFLLSSLDFAAFGEAAVAAEKIYAKCQEKIRGIIGK